MSGILSGITSIFTAAIGWVGEVAEAIAGTTTANGVTSFDNPILLLFCALPLVGLGVGLFRRLINVN